MNFVARVYFTLLLFIIPILLGIPACKKSSTLTPPITVDPTPTHTPTPVVCWYNSEISRVNDVGAVSHVVFLIISVNGIPETSASVTFIPPEGAISVPYNSIVHLGGTNYASYSYSGGGWTYQPGGQYILETYTTGGRTAVTVTAPGGITHQSDGLLSSWLYEGFNDTILVWYGSSNVTYSSTSYVSDLISPASIPVSAYSAPGTYKLVTNCTKQITGISNADDNSYLNIYDQYITEIIK